MTNRRVVVVGSVRTGMCKAHRGSPNNTRPWGKPRRMSRITIRSAAKSGTSSLLHSQQRTATAQDAGILSEEIVPMKVRRVVSQAGTAELIKANVIA